MHRFLTTLSVFALLLLAIPSSRSQATALWYDAPASDWETEALPIGNGRIGAMLFGKLGTDQIQFNDISLWTGDENRMGSHQAFGDVFVTFKGRDGKAPESYRRSLDIEKGVYRVEYTLPSGKYEMLAFASHPADAILIRYQCVEGEPLSGSIELTDAHDAPLHAAAGMLVRNGMIGPDSSDPETAVRYESRLLASGDGKALKAKEGKLEFKKCKTLEIHLLPNTGYAMDVESNFQGESPATRNDANAERLSGRDFDDLLQEHVVDFQALSQRVSIDLGKTEPEIAALPTNQRIERYTESGQDPELEALLYQFGRYLLQSSSRGFLPANLQGLWNNSLTPPWNGDYHTNINVQMNYWPVEVANLSECHMPFLNLVTTLAPVFREHTVNEFQELAIPGDTAPRGWTVRTSHNPFGGMDWLWNKTGNAWYAQHFWEHYAFTQDKTYLAEVAYPLMKSVCQYWEDGLKELEDGMLVVPDGWSPEHGPHEDGVSYDQQIVWDLFNNTVETLDTLGIEPEYRAKLADMRDRLAGPQIGSWGQLMEWRVDRDDPHDTHRHVSHLFGLFPGRQFSPTLTPELAEAARISLDARGNAGTSWSMAWKICFWARLLNGDRAHYMLRGMLAVPGSRLKEMGTGEGTESNSYGGVYPNMLSAHPPFQIDGNFGAVAGISEMLLQSQAGEISLLPALPSVWPTGSISGLKARGNVQVSMEWESGALSKASLMSPVEQTVQVRSGAKVVELTLPANVSVSLDSDLMTTTD